MRNTFATWFLGKIYLGHHYSISWPKKLRDWSCAPQLWLSRLLVHIMKMKVDWKVDRYFRFYTILQIMLIHLASIQKVVARTISKIWSNNYLSDHIFLPFMPFLNMLLIILCILPIPLCMACIGFLFPLKGPKVPVTLGSTTQTSRMATKDSLNAFILKPVK